MKPSISFLISLFSYLFTHVAALPQLIAFEEHYLDPVVVNASTANAALYASQPSAIVSRLYDTSSTRLSNLANNTIYLQILSHGPVAYVPPSLATTANNNLHSIVQKSSQQKHTTAQHTRYAALALLPVSDPPAAAQELKRTVHHLGFPGALINNHDNGTFYDSPKYYPLFAAATELNVPLYLHPMYPTVSLSNLLYDGNYAPSVSVALGSKSFGWHANTGLHILRLFAAGVFDAYPTLKIVIGHMGEMLPFQLGRILDSEALLGTHERGLRQVWQENIWVTTSGMFTLAPIKAVLDVCPIEKVMFSVDYPFSTNEQGKGFMEELAGSGLVSDDELEMIGRGNAERLFGIKL
ncbi:MAG: hypothetical protein Q9227_000634 [Pyrenula ochraceoflavens]